ncbi:MAG: family 78 glycoside hydrolase catalytic domain [Sphingobacteriaceae bacterium]|nr:family 78 glycoside hydrolase catalytic domain [Sphingobacteriaceae bacterium]
MNLNTHTLFLAASFGCITALLSGEKDISFTKPPVVETVEIKSSSLKSPDYLQCEARTNPRGIDIARPSLSWNLSILNSSVRGASQSAYEILVASTPQLLNDGKGDLWSTGKIASDEMNKIVYAGKSLQSHQTVYWKVRAWDQDKKVSDWSPVNQWITGLLKVEDWAGAKWIGAPSELDSAVNSTFLLRKEFSVKPGLKRAILSVCGLGQYEMTLNGKYLTETLLNPGWTQYDKTCLYDTYDVTSLLNSGANAAGLLITNGMYRVKKGGRYAKIENNFGRLQAIAKITFEYTDGSTGTLITDNQWKTGESPMTWSSIYGGEDWDARKVQHDWDKAGFNDSEWYPVVLQNGPGGVLKGITHAAPPIRMFQVHKPVSSKEIKPRVTIYDLGQDASYVSTFTVSGSKGSAIKITPSELLKPDGTLFTNNYNGKSYSVYTLAGTGKESYTSKFFTTGCRYYQVECIPAAGSTELPKVESIAGIVVHSDNPFAGEFSSSNELFNRINKMVRWAELSNMKSVISDCPHRERLGWLEQSHLHGPSFRYNYDMRQLFGKIIHDMNDTKQANGLVPCIAPELTTFGPDWREAIEWGSAGVLIPWQQYQWTGDLEVLRQNYPMMKGYVEYLTSKANNGIAAVGKGDWSGRRTSPSTPKELVSTAFYFHNAEVLAKSAKLLGNQEEAAKQQALAQSIRQVFNKTFFNPKTKQYGTGSQCANSMALVMGLVEPADRKAVLTNLVADIENRKYENTTGEVGMRYLFEALADGGRSDVAYRMNNQSEKPGYGYQIKMGATALPETWDAWRDNSQNQFMLGHIIQWFYHDLAGIQLDTGKPGYKSFIIRPHVVEDLTLVKASYKSIKGNIVSEWKRIGKKFSMHVIVPPNTTALINIPAKAYSFVTEGGKPITQAKGVKVKGMDSSYAIVQVGSGDYKFSSTMP